MRVGVLGVGYWGSKHLRVLLEIPQVSSVVAIDRVGDRLKAIEASLPAVSCFNDLSDALSHVDALVIATPPRSHAELAIQALSAGKHVLVEKPMTTSVADAHDVMTLATQCKRTLMVGHTFEYNMAVWKLREAIRTGQLGNICYIDSARLNLGLYQEDVNVVWDLAPHDISIMNYLLEVAPDTVDAWGATHAQKNVEDVAYLRLEYKSKRVSAHTHVSWLDPCKVRRVTVVGDRMMAVYNDLAAEERIRLYDKGVAAPPPDVAPDTAMHNPPTNYRYGSVLSPYIDFAEPLLVQDSHFVQSIMTGTKPDTDGLSGLRVVAVLEAAEVSMRERTKVSLKDIAPEFATGRLRSAAIA